MNLSTGSADAVTAKVSADTPGITSGSIPARTASRIRKKPGSASDGVPASDTAATVSPR